MNAQEINLNIQGRDSAETKYIDELGYQKKHPNLLSLKKEADTLLVRLHKQGFINSFYNQPEQKEPYHYSVYFQLGEKIELLKIYFSENLEEAIFLKKHSIELAEDYFLIPFNQTETFLGELNNQISSQGKPFSQLSLSHIRRSEGHTLEADLVLSDTRIRKLDSIVIKGYEKFPTAFLKNHARIKSGQVFDKNKLLQKVERLKSLEFAKVIREPEVLFTDEQTMLYLYLEKHNNNRFDGFLGFATDEDNGKLRLDGDLTLKLVNNLNYGEAFHLHYKNTGNDRQHFNTGLHLPYLFSTPVGIKLELDLLRQDSTYTTNTHSAILTYKIYHRLALNLGYKGAASNNLNNNGALAGKIIEDFNSDFLTFGGTYEEPNLNHPLFQLKTLLNLEIGLGNRKRKNNKEAQQWFNLSGEQIFDIDLRNSFFVGGKISGLFSPYYLDNELMRFGGINSIRGFEENNLSASFFAGIRTEYRYILTSELYAHSILDYAYLENGAAGAKNNLYGLGFGLGMQTGAGLLRLAFANGKSDGETFSFDNTRIHLSLSAIF